MNGAVVLAGLTPHPPIAVPEVGKDDAAKVAKTAKALGTLAREIPEARADTLVVITPHGPVFSDAVAIRSQLVLRGNLAGFGAPRVRVEYPNDLELTKAIEKESAGLGVTVALMDDRKLSYYGLDKDLDHGTVVPLSFIANGGFAGKLVVVNIGFLSLFDLYRFGAAIEKAAFGIGRRIAVIASGDLSHRLLPGAPAGYNPRGKEFDAKIMDILDRFEPSEAVTFPADLAEDAGECGLRPIVMMLGTLDNYTARSKRLSYEGPFGVGYGVALLYPCPAGEGFSRLDSIEGARNRRIMDMRAGESFPVALARATVESLVKGGRRRVAPAPADVPPEFQKPAGVFVSIHKEGMLRGCIGTTEPTEKRAADEIVSNAVSAAERDPRFDPVEALELDLLDYSVDILSLSEPVLSEDRLDPRVYGVIVSKGGRKGLLLPDLPGVDTVEEQLRIAKQKAGIGLGEKGVALRRLTVTRYH